MRQFWNVANQLTLFRLLLIPGIVIAILYGHHVPALVLLLIAAATDAVDGLAARWLNQRTALGAYLDPIADKLLLSSCFFVLALIRSVPWWIAILVLSRDLLILITTLVVALFTPIRRFPPSVLGKMNTTIQVAAIFAVVVRNAYPHSPLSWTALPLVWLTAMSTVASGAHYAIFTFQRFEKID